MKATVRELSDNELSEALNLCSEITHLINRHYIHVPTPPSVCNPIINWQNALNKELERREDEETFAHVKKEK